MKRVKFAPLFPLDRGLDRSSTPGTQDLRALRIAKNVYSGSTPSLKKRPGTRRIPHIGENDGVQAAIHFFGTRGGAQFQEVIRVRKGKIEALRDFGGSDPQFVVLKKEEDDGTLSDFTVSSTDTIVFERFVNSLVIHFENTRPHQYVIGGNLTELPLLTGHESQPPTFSRRHNYRWWYSGRRSFPHHVWASAANSITDFSLLSGGFSMRLNDGDGDPVGLTGLSPPFRGNLYASKWTALYQIYVGDYGYGWKQITDESGAVHHNAITSNRYDVYMVDISGIQSLTRIMTQAGSPEEIALTRKIYDYFQSNVNWSNSKNMVLVYDKPTGGLMLSYARASSSVNDSVLYMSPGGEFFEWEGIEYPSIAKYFEFGRQRTMVADNERGISLLDDTINTLNGDPISVEVQTDVIFPMGPKMEIELTQGWLLCRPSLKGSPVMVHTSIDGRVESSDEVDTLGTGYGSTIADTLNQGGELIGSDIIGRIPDDMAIMPFNLAGEGSAIRFRVTQNPTESDPDQPFEAYGILYEYNYDEDTEQKKTT